MEKERIEQQSSRDSRRKFLQKAGVGLVISSFPVRSVWANGGGLTGSIIASGAGSQYGTDSNIALLSKGFFKKNASSLPANGIFLHPYSKYFGANPPGYSGQQDPTIFEVLVGRNVILGLQNLDHRAIKTNGKDPRAVSFSADAFQMVTMLLNAYYAINDPSLGINYPIIGSDHSSQFFDVFAYGTNLSSMYYPGIGNDISDLIRNNHA